MNLVVLHLLVFVFFIISDQGLAVIEGDSQGSDEVRGITLNRMGSLLNIYYISITIGLVGSIALSKQQHRQIEEEMIRSQNLIGNITELQRSIDLLAKELEIVII